MKTEMLNLEKQRRTIYALGKKVDFANAEIADLIKNVMKQAPTAFNSQTTRAVIAFGDSHDKVWEIVRENLRKVVKDDEAFKTTSAKIDGFKAAYATVLFFTDMDVVHNLEEQFPAYADNFYDWSEQAMGNSNFAVWTALAENGLGVSLQHYNPLIDEDIRAAFDVPASWRLRAEMPFGSIEQGAGDKEFMADEDRFKVFD
ncbi:MAG TPA: nitroreductase family protein [Candidatus Limosilactobacillus faecipullorum]|nr:nitroreductase family protein [Candidatus Limosilactobacillus faecipullorum]